MNLEAALRDLTDALATPATGRRRDAGLRAARRVVAERLAAALRPDVPGGLSLGEVILLVPGASERRARRDCAVLVIHALAVPGLVPAASAAGVCALMERVLRDVLLRCGYPFGAPVEQKLQVLERLHANVAELMQPMEPTFPSGIQGLHAG